MAEADVDVELLKRIKQASELLLSCQEVLDIPGKEKLVKKIQAELHFLKKVSRSTSIRPDHIKSSNLSHLSAIVKCCSKMDGVVKILEPFVFYKFSESNSVQKRIVIDVVCDHGKTWVKTIARNPLAVLQLSTGAGKFGQKSVVEQVTDIIECAKQNKYLFSPPKVAVWFSGCFIKELKDLLKETDVEIFFSDENTTTTTTMTPSSSSSSEAMNSVTNLNVQKDKLHLVSSQCHFSHISDCFMHPLHIECNMTLCSIPEDAVLNLDISTMIAHISNMTNGYANANFADGILHQQAKRELISSVRNVLTNLFKGRKLICCSLACTNFKDIVSCIGGPMEKERATQLLQQLTVVPDSPSEKAMMLQTSSRIKPRSKIIFGTGDTQKAVTVTANLGFLRAAQGQGAHFVAVFHESRALSELKELPE